jgi:hypothetical protein
MTSPLCVIRVGGFAAATVRIQKGSRHHVPLVVGCSGVLSWGVDTRNEGMAKDRSDWKSPPKQTDRWVRIEKMGARPLGTPVLGDDSYSGR